MIEVEDSILNIIGIQDDFVRIKVIINDKYEILTAYPVYKDYPASIKKEFEEDLEEE